MRPRRFLSILFLIGPTVTSGKRFSIAGRKKRREASDDADEIADGFDENRRFPGFKGTLSTSRVVTPLASEQLLDGGSALGWKLEHNGIVVSNPPVPPTTRRRGRRNDETQLPMFRMDRRGRIESLEDDGGVSAAAAEDLRYAERPSADGEAPRLTPRTQPQATNRSRSLGRGDRDSIEPEAEVNSSEPGVEPRDALMKRFPTRDDRRGKDWDDALEEAIEPYLAMVRAINLAAARHLFMHMFSCFEGTLRCACCPP